MTPAELIDIMKQDGTALCRLPGSDNAPRWGVFRRPVGIIRAERPDEVPGAVTRLEVALTEGMTAAGFMAYEAAPAFDPHFRVMEPESGEPLCLFALYPEPPVVIEPPYLNDFAPGFDFTPELSREAYTQALDEIRRHLIAGDIYQANFTFRSFRPDPIDEPERLFLNLLSRHPAPYAAFLNLDGRRVLSLSPELFLERSGTVIRSSPMKGTARREPDAARDRAMRRYLAHDEKNRAENLMITDLVRNDLGRICRPGSVAVDPLFRVDTYSTVHQMISTVHGELPSGITLTDIFRGTFPAASITGAPKIRAMEIIAENEKSPRGVYCGSVGCFLSVESFCLNVAIRTVYSTPSGSRLGIGGGIVLDSEPESEWREALLKSRYVNYAVPEFQVLETIGWDRNGGFIGMEEHLARMCGSQLYFGRPWRENEVRAALEQAAAELRNNPPPETGCSGARLTLARDGGVTCEIFPPRPAWNREGVHLKLSSCRVHSDDPFLYHKTTCRALFDCEFRQAIQEGFGEVVFLNEKGFLTEGAISSLFLKKNGCWRTPRLENGLLPGIWRQQQIRQLGAEEADLGLEDLANADEIRIGNSVRGAANAFFNVPRG